MTMNIFGKKSSQNEINYKSRLEHKLYLARENPEPVFDLSECNLKIVPSGVYSLCKVFRKEMLLLQINQLSSLSGGGSLSDLHLLTHLDLHQNHLTAIPEDFVHLSNLKVLNVSFNQLRKLPEVIGCLLQLQTLDCSHNKLVSLPSSLVQLKFLKTLDLRGNPNLSTFPTLLNVDNLLVDENMKDHLPKKYGQTSDTHPSFNQCATGKTEGEHNSESTPLCEQMCTFQGGSVIEDSFKFLEKKKEEKHSELLGIEKSLWEQKDEEIRKHKSITEDKEKLLLDIREQQKKIEEDVNRLQSQKDEERCRLLNYLLKVEKQAGERTEDLITLSQALRRASHWQDQEARERQLQDEYKHKSHQLRRKEVINAMESLLAEECAQKAKLIEYEKNKTEIIQSSLSREVEWREQVDWLLGVRDAHQSAVVAAVETDADVQKALVATLLERSDLHSRGLVMQVALIQQQLSVLTDVELQRKKLDSAHHLNDLAEKRKALSELLVELLNEQHERRKQLISHLQELEMDRQLSGSSTDYWLKQYQRLLDVRPPQLLASLDPELVHEVVMAGAAHCLPFLSCCDINSLTASQLAQVGVTSVEDQAAVIGAVTAYKQLRQAQVSPSAPPLSPEYQPSETTLHNGSECVVCMETMCDIVFVPCGHLCTCSSCASHLLLCPLCRASLHRKIQVFS